MRNLACILFIGLLGACVTVEDVEDGNNRYYQGYNDGCSTGKSGSLVKNTGMMHDYYYDKGWKEGMQVCKKG